MLNELVGKILSGQRSFRFDEAFSEEEGTGFLHALSLLLVSDLRVCWHDDRKGFLITSIVRVSP